jgi:hypothetical protein
MPPVSTNPKDFPFFGKLDRQTMDARLTDILEPLKYFSVNELCIDWNTIQFSKRRVSTLVDMVQRRRVYFHIYHGIDMGELNEACLICFWILKLNPFYRVDNPEYNANLTFALALFTRAVTYTANRSGKKANFSRRIVEHLIHDFTYRDLSKEAVMAIAESLIY